MDSVPERAGVSPAELDARLGLVLMVSVFWSVSLNQEGDFEKWTFVHLGR